MKSRKTIETLLEIEEALQESEAALPIALKIKLAELILGTMRRKNLFGLFVILGWNNKWQKFTDISDSDQDIFARHHINIKSITDEKSRYNLAATVDFDGAILVNKRGDVVHSGVIIEGLRPRVIAEKLNQGSFKDLSEQFGFKQKVHARHLSAITASYIFKDTTVFTVSEETGALHIFEKGRIIYSTVSGEMA